MTRIIYRHWKTDEELVCEGEVCKNHPESDRLVVKCADKFEDILKETIVKMEEI